MEIDTGSNIRSYQEYWRLVLRHVCEWDESRIEAWIQHKMSLYPGDSIGMLFHELPEYYLAREFIPIAVLERIEPILRERMLLRVQDALSGPNFDQDYATGADLLDAKRRVDEVLRSFTEKE